jgi:DNA-binding GntR family transcriptional regulator
VSDQARNKLSHEVYERIKQGIFDFHLPPGHRYSESALAEMLSVSRTPLRLALHILEHEGYLHNTGGHNCWQVRPLDLSYYEDLYDFRSELEALAIRLAEKVHLEAPLSQAAAFWCVGKASRLKDPELVREQDEQLHIAIVGLANNKSMLRSFTDITDRIRIIRRLDFNSERRIVAAYDDHKAIIDAIRSGRMKDAQRLVRDHIETSREEIRRITVHNMNASRLRSVQS